MAAPTPRRPGAVFQKKSGVTPPRFRNCSEKKLGGAPGGGRILHARCHSARGGAFDLPREALGRRGRARSTDGAGPVPRCHGYARASTLLTDLAYHAPPRAVAMPRAFNASAIWCSD